MTAKHCVSAASSGSLDDLGSIQNDQQEVEYGNDDDNDNNNHAEQDEDLDDEDLDALLETMDIDKDFNMWNSFRSSVAAKSPKANKDGATTGDDSFLSSLLEEGEEEDQNSPGAEASFDSVWEQDDEQWDQRLAREEVFSRRYHPSAQEAAELKDITRLLGMTPQKSTRRVLFRSRSNESENGIDRKAWDALFEPNASQPCSILLKRGPCLWEQTLECELILLTHGLLIATIVPRTETSGKQHKVQARRLARVILLSQIKHVATCPVGWQLQTETEQFTFICTTFKQQEKWLQAMERVLLQYALHSKAVLELGWQYNWIYKPAFTMAVTGHVPDSTTPLNVPAEELNQLDAYNGLAPLHYAVRANHVPAIQALLDAGADPNVKDKHNHTPMYYAQREGLPEDTLAVLAIYGAVQSKEADAAEYGALFGQVGATERKMEEKKHRDEEVRKLEEERKAEIAQQKMAQNLRLLEERGEKIEELGSKATQLNQDAQDFASLAKQLKEKAKGNTATKKKWYQL